MADAILPDVQSSGIYQIRNLVNGKRYIGSAINFARRWRQHRSDLGKGRNNRHLQNAWRKHGEESFVFEIVEVVADKARLIDREQHYIDAWRPEYNIAITAGSNLGTRWPDEVRKRMSLANGAVWKRPGHRQRMSDAHKGQVPTEEQRRKISKAHAGRKLSGEHAAIVAANNAARNRSEKHRALISDFWKGRPKPPEQIAKMVASKTGRPAHNRGKPMSAEQKAKQSSAMKAKYLDPEFREKIIQTTRAAMRRPEVMAKVLSAKHAEKHSEQTRRRMSESHKLRWARRKAQ